MAEKEYSVDVAGLPEVQAHVAGLRQEIERLRTVLRSLISCGGTSPIIKAMAMNTLEMGSGDAWLEAQRA